MLEDHRTRFEFVEDMYPELKFYAIPVNHPGFHGKIEGTDVYINAYQPEDDQIQTMIHEGEHYRNDSMACCSLVDMHSRRVLEAEGRANRGSRVIYRAIFGTRYMQDGLVLHDETATAYYG